MDRRRLLKLVALGGSAVAAGSLAVSKAQAASRYYRGPVSDHFDGRHFFNPGGEEPNGFGDLLRWKFNGERSTWPTKWPEPFQKAIPAQRVGNGDLRVTMVGHATMLIQVAGMNILTDPVWSDRASPFSFAGPQRISEPGVDFDALPPIDLVLLTHNHYDHMDVDTLARLHAGHRPIIVTPLGNDVIVRQRVPGARIEVQDWGNALQVGLITIHCEPTHHWSARGMFDRRMALWASFVLETPADRIYHIGDTGFHGGINYRDAQRKHGGFRLACLPIGAYEPRWFMKAQHQDPAEAVEGMRLAQAEFAVGHHWGTFQLTDEAVDAPRQALFAALDDASISRSRFRPLAVGDVWDVPLTS